MWNLAEFIFLDYELSNNNYNCKNIGEYSCLNRYYK